MKGDFRLILSLFMKYCYILCLLNVNVFFSQDIDFKLIPMLFDTPNFFSNTRNSLVNYGKKIENTNFDHVISGNVDSDEKNIYNGVIVSKNQLDSLSKVKYSLNLSEYKSINDLIKGDFVYVDGIYQSEVGVILELDLDKLFAKVAFINPDDTIGIAWFKIKNIQKIITI